MGGGAAAYALSKAGHSVLLIEKGHSAFAAAAADGNSPVPTLPDARLLMGQFFVLAAGAYFSPVLLLNSTSQAWPEGLANHHDQVGRNLMLHVSDFIAIWPRGRYSREGTRRSIGLRDLYRHGDVPLGKLQSTGIVAGYPNVLHALKRRFDRSQLRRLRPLRPFLRVPAFAACRLFGEASAFASIIEDHPYADNRVLSDERAPSGMRFQYTVRPELEERVRIFRQLLKQALPDLHMLVLSDGVNLNFGHPCGTCRAGTDVRTSVVDSSCKAHGLSNLYIADASVFPTSGGANPSLTLAANSCVSRMPSSSSSRASAAGRNSARKRSSPFELPTPDRCGSRNWARPRAPGIPGRG